MSAHRPTAADRPASVALTREIIRLRDEAHRSWGEIAIKVGISRAAVRARYQRRGVRAEGTRLTRIEAAARRYQAAVEALDGVAAAEAALFDALKETSG